MFSEWNSASSSISVAARLIGAALTAIPALSPLTDERRWQRFNSCSNGVIGSLKLACRARERFRTRTGSGLSTNPTPKWQPPLPLVIGPSPLPNAHNPQPLCFVHRKDSNDEELCSA